MNRLEDKLSLLPKKPGCYLMKNRNGVIIYVGKAKNLNSRVKSYFRGKHFGKTERLVSEINDFDTIIVDSETEALILELNLIKKYDPKYNILLRDDKSYPYIELTDEEFPRLIVVRDINKRKNKHSKMFGPYPNVYAAREVVGLLNRIYPLRKCVNLPKKVCLYYHLDQCLGYCEKNIEKDVINKINSDVLSFLNGNHSEVSRKLTEDMVFESNKMNYEKALEYKNTLNYIETTLEKQKVEIRENIAMDIMGYYEYDGYLGINMFFIRSGRIVGNHFSIISIIDDIFHEIERYVVKLYDKTVLKPGELLVPTGVNTVLLSEHLGINVRIPKIGTKKHLMEMSNMNAKTSLLDRFELIKREEDRTINANNELKDLLGLDSLDRIELFDISHLFGSFNVGGMVVYKNGLKSKTDYRKFKIEKDVNDDYGALREVIYRRYYRVLIDNLEKPDLIIVDGGIGQINIAREVIDSLNIGIKVVGLKKDDKHATTALIDSDTLEEKDIEKNSNLFLYLESMQDEVHRYAINYHKQIRSKGSISSILDGAPGIGEVRKKELIKKYGSITRMKAISAEEFSLILPNKAAEDLHEYLKEIEI